MKWKRILKSTFVKYIFSYIIILGTVVIGVYFIMNYQLKQEYIREYQQETQDQIANAAKRISEGFLEIEKTNLLLSSDMNIINARYYNNEAYSRYQIVKELGKYCSRNILSQDIVYFDKKKGMAYSTTRQCDVSDGAINLTMHGKDDIFLPESFYDSDDFFGRIYKATNGVTTLLVFSPNNFSSGFRVLYILDEQELCSIMESCLARGVSGVKLTDASGSTILSAGAAFPSAKEGHSRQSTEEVFRWRFPYPALNFSAVLDPNFMQSFADTVFINAYLMVGLLILVAVGIIFFSMRITYFPLHELKKRFTSSRDPFSNDITLLHRTCQESEEMNMLLKKSLDNYKTVIHGSILNSRYLSRNISNVVLENIDKLFTSGKKMILSVVKVLFTNLSAEDAIGQIQLHFREDFTVVILEADQKHTSVLLAGGDEKNTYDRILKKRLRSLSGRIPCRIAFSNCSNSLLDIARLYSNATAAESYLDRNCRIIGYDDVSRNVDNYNRSYQLFDQLAAALEQMNPEKSICLIKELFDSIDIQNDSEIFIRCVLIDTTTLISTSMNRNAVKYETYYTVVTHLLDLCRKSNYVQTREEILDLFYTLLNILFSEASGTKISIAQIETFVQENFCHSDFSILMMAGHFHVSTACMSSVFKKSLGMNFSSYVWFLRFEKAKRLLSATNYSIEKISGLIGYDHASSFRRKFKEESGVSPSSYRENMRKPLYLER